MTDQSKHQTEDQTQPKKRKKRRAKKSQEEDPVFKRLKCANHPERRAIRFCDRCDKPYCQECTRQYWSHNYIRYAFLGEQKRFDKEYLCVNCEKAKRRRGIAVTSVLLVIIVIFILGSIYNS